MSTSFKDSLYKTRLEINKQHGFYKLVRFNESVKKLIFKQ